MAPLIQAGVANKTSAVEVISFDKAFNNTPVVVVSPYYKGSEGGVGYAETIINITKTQFTVASSNAASNYFVTWIAVEPS